jgi:hypothetical protein
MFTRFRTELKIFGTEALARQTIVIGTSGVDKLSTFHSVLLRGGLLHLCSQGFFPIISCICILCVNV